MENDNRVDLMENSNVNREVRETEKKKRALEASYAMHKESIREMIEKRRNTTDDNGNRVYSDNSILDTKELMEEATKDVVEQYIALGGTVQELEASRERNKYQRDKEFLRKLFDKYDEEDECKRSGFASVKTSEETQVKEEPIRTESKKEVVVNSFNVATQNVDRQSNNFIQYELVNLPSKGEGYKNKVSRLPVGYLTANDENLIVSPNMYQNGTFLDYMVASKLMSNDLKVDELLLGDFDAIVMWLRGSSYGEMFPVTATDNETGVKFNTEVNLSELKDRPFNLKGDENGYFDYEMPVSKDKIKFRFLTVGDMRELEKIEAYENISVRKANVADICGKLREIANDDDEMDKKTKVKFNEAVKLLEGYRDGIVERENQYTHTITNKMIKNIVSVNGITDRGYINGYVANMNVRDANSFRRYVNDNAPGVDFNIEVERPESLGGGSTTVFLSVDQYVFLNRPE